MAGQAVRTAVAILESLGVPIPDDSIVQAYRRLAGTEDLAWQTYANLVVLGTMNAVTQANVTAYERMRVNLLIAQNSLRLETIEQMRQLGITLNLNEPVALPPYAGPIRSEGEGTSGLRGFSGLGQAQAAPPAAAAGALASPVSWSMAALLGIMAAIAAAAIAGVTIYAVYSARETLAKIVLAAIDAVENYEESEQRLSCIGRCMAQHRGTDAASQAQRQQCITACIAAVPRHETRVGRQVEGSSWYWWLLGGVVLTTGGYAAYRYFGGRAAIAEGTSGSPRSLQVTSPRTLAGGGHR